MSSMSWEQLAARANYKPRELAGICKVSIRTLQRHFARQYGVTLGGWLREVRISQAYSRIASGESIKAVAYDLGFKQLSHFSRAFKEVYGVSPRQVILNNGQTASRLAAFKEEAVGLLEKANNLELLLGMQKSFSHPILQRHLGTRPLAVPHSISNRLFN